MTCLTFVILVQPFLERIQGTLAKPEYAFFRQPGVFLLSENQVPELVAIIGALVIERHTNSEMQGHRPRTP